MSDIICCPKCQRRLWCAAGQGAAVQCPSCDTRFEVEPIEAVQSPGTAAQLVPLPLVGESAPQAAEQPPFVLPVLQVQNTSARATGVRRPLRTLAVLAVVVVVAVLGVLSFVHSSLRPAPPRLRGPIAGPADTEEARLEVRQALAGQQPLAEEEIAGQLKPVFEGLGNAMQQRDAGTMAAHFDVERMYDELVIQQVLPPQLRGDRTMIRGMRQGLGNALQGQAALLEWDRFEIRSVKKLSNSEAAVIVRHHLIRDAVLKMRWWVTNASGTWKIYDFEDLDMGLRQSTSMASIAGMGFRQVQETGRAMRHVREALLAIVVQENLDAGEKHLRMAEKIPLPGKLDAVRQMVTGQLHLNRQQFKEAQEAFDRAQRLHPDMPCLDLLKGMTCNRLGQWQKAVEHLRAYRELLGDDAVLCYELGEALRGVQQFTEAGAAYRTALDHNPKYDDAFLGLLRSLAPGDKRDDLEKRFAQLGNFHDNFDICAEDCKESRDGASLEPIALAMRKIDPEYAAVDYYLALAKVWQGKPDEAVPLFRPALTKQKDPDKRRAYLASLMQAGATSGKALEAYASVPDAREAFRFLAPELKQAYRMDDLKKLVLLHAKSHADDRWLPFYRGEVLVSEDKYQQAAKSFAAGMARPPEEGVLDQFRYSRVRALYQCGQALDALATIGPRADTFRQVASQCWQDRNFALLQKIVAAQARDNPESEDMLRYRFGLKIKQDELAEGILQFKAVLAKVTDEQRRNALIADFLEDMSEVDALLDGYRAAPDAKQAFLILAPELLEQDKYKELEQLLALHRQKAPDDIWLGLYAGKIQAHKNAWDQAVQVLGEAMKKAPDELRGRFHWDYVNAMYRSGRGLQAYREEEADQRSETFHQLAYDLINDKKGADLEALIDAHRPHASAPGDLLFLQARAKVLLKKPAEAIALFHKAYEQQANDDQRHSYVSSFVNDMDELGQALEGYRAVPDKSTAFQTLAARFTWKKKAEKLKELLEEHGKDNAVTPHLNYYWGQWHLLRQEFPQADQRLTAAATHRDAADEWMFRSGLNQARVKAGRVVATYRERGAGRAAFESLAQVCIDDKNADQLRLLLAAHREAEPDDPGLPVWDVELRWLRDDYAGALEILTRESAGAFALPRYRWKHGTYLVRCLVRLKRTKEALAEAEAVMKAKMAGPALLVLAHAAHGGPKPALAVLEKLQPPAHVVRQCYELAELGALLRSPAFAEFRAKFPEPEAGSAED